MEFTVADAEKYDEEMQKLDDEGKLKADADFAQHTSRIITDILKNKEEISAAVTREQFNDLVDDACVAANVVAMQNRATMGLDEAVKTRNIVKRTVEFLIGNGLLKRVEPREISVVFVEPPYHAKYLERE